MSIPNRSVPYHSGQQRQHHHHQPYYPQHQSHDQPPHYEDDEYIPEPSRQYEGVQQYKYVNDETNPFDREEGEFVESQYQPQQQQYNQQQYGQQQPQQQPHHYDHQYGQGQQYAYQPQPQQSQSQYHGQYVQQQQQPHQQPYPIHPDQVHLHTVDDVGTPDHPPPQTIEIGGPPSKVYNDKWFIVAFGVHLLFMLILAFVYGPWMISDSDQNLTNGSNENDLGSPNGFFMIILFLAANFGIVISLYWLNVITRYSTQIIHISLTACVILAIVGFIVALTSANPWMAAFFIIAGVLMCVYYYYIRARIPFAVAILEASVASLKKHRGLIYLAYGLSVVNIAFVVLWSFIVAAVIHAGEKVITVDNPDGSYYQYRAGQSAGLQFIQFMCVFSLYWTCQTIKNIGHVTTAGTVASWWFQPQLTSPIFPAFIRSITTSLGSIIFGSLLVAIVQTIRALLNSARRDTCGDVMDCLLKWVESGLKWFNRYCFSTIGIYGMTYMDSARRTGELFKAQLFTALINDDLSGMVLFCGNFLTGSVVGVGALIWAYRLDAPSYQLYGILAFLVGYLVSSLSMSVAQSAITTTFVCWASDPATLLQNRPVEFGRILTAAQFKYSNMGLQEYNGQQQQQQQQHEQHHEQQHREQQQY